LIEKFEMENCKEAATPIVTGTLMQMIKELV